MICDKCKQDKDDVLRRGDITDNAIVNADGVPIAAPALCTDCCAGYPGREWMRPS